MVILPISKYSECQFQVLNIYPSLARASSSDLTRSSFLQPGPAHVLFYLRKPPQLSRYVSLSAPCVSRISISVISHTEVISSTTFIQVTAAEGEASEEQSLVAAAAPGTAAVHGSGGGENAGTGA